MSCPYYWYNHHYACKKSGKDVNSDIYEKYCQGYDYRDCPIYKGEEVSGCFLTSACVEAKGLADTCHELTVLRHFRDNYLRDRKEGEAEIREYYFVAPQVVAAIKKEGNSKEVFDGIYTNLVQPCVEMIEQGKNEDAYQLYKETVLKLKDRYIN